MKPTGFPPSLSNKYEIRHVQPKCTRGVDGVQNRVQKGKKIKQGREISKLIELDTRGTQLNGSTMEDGRRRKRNNERIYKENNMREVGKVPTTKPIGSEVINLKIMMRRKNMLIEETSNMRSRKKWNTNMLPTRH